MNLLKPYNRLTWKTVMTINLAILVLGGVFMAQKAVQAPTQTGSKAAAPVVTPVPLPQYPAESPRLTGIKLFYGRPGDTVRLEGSHLGDHQWGSSISGIPNNNILSWSDTAIDFTIPQSLASGPLTVLVNGKSATTAYPLIITHAATDPELILNNNRLTIIKAPVNTTLTYKYLQETTVYTTSITKETQALSPLTSLQNLEYALLKDKAGTILPLYINPQNL